MYFESTEAVLFDNGPLITLAGGGCSGGDLSSLQTALTLTSYGFNFNQAGPYFIADDFTANANWNVDSIKFFAYQSFVTTVTITGVYVQIWNGAPNAGGTIVYGDLTTNRLQRAGFSSIYRALDTAPTNCDRRIQEVVATIGTNLPAGTYWVQVGLTGSSTSGPWCPPVTLAGQTGSGNALQFTTGAWAALVDGTFPQDIPFLVYGNSGAPCPVGPATNPSPVSGATNVSINPGNATWTNGAGTNNVEVFFGPAGNSVSVYSGAPIETIAIPGPLDYATTYEWKVVCKNDTCSGAPVATWTFTTEQDPLLATLFFDDFEAGTGNWTITNLGGTCDWNVWTSATWESISLPTLPGGTAGQWLGANSDGCGSGTTVNSEIKMTNGIDMSQYQMITLSYDSDFRIFSTDLGTLDVSIDGGTTWTNIRTLQGASVRNEQIVDQDISSYCALQPDVRFRLTYYGAYDYWWCLDNILIEGSGLVPVEFTSFAATTDNRNVTLNWSTATELNNSGFQVERSSGSAYEVVGFVAGSGTTTEIRNYNFVDQNVASGTYSYRLKQVDFDGTFEYSNAIEVEVVGVKEFALGQNYPNPFNPSTTINFSLAVDSKVSLKIFDVLGQEVATLINGQMAAGSQKVSFDASSLNSGVYFYRIDASGVDGQKFSSVKKMILTK